MQINVQTMPISSIIVVWKEGIVFLTRKWLTSQNTQRKRISILIYFHHPKYMEKNSSQQNFSDKLRIISIFFLNRLVHFTNVNKKNHTIAFISSKYRKTHFKILVVSTFLKLSNHILSSQVFKNV